VGLLSRELLFTALTRTKKDVILFVQANNDTELRALLDKVRTTSSIAGIRTTLVIGDAREFAYVPDAGIPVKSRVEYIIYRKLAEAANSTGAFTFKYEHTYELKKHAFLIHPDFTIWLADGRTVFWEHLGRLNDRNYVEKWDQRRALYDEMGDLGRVMTTHELKGISDEKIDKIVGGLVAETLSTEDPSNRYSPLHLSLR
jgi:hypothetical protein